MEEIDLKEMFKYFKSKIYIIVLVTFLILALGTCYSLFVKKPKYTSSSTIVLASSESGSTANMQVEVALNQKLVGTYREIVKSRSVLERVIEDLDLKYRYEELSNKVGVSSVADTEIIKISVVDENPKTAQKIARSVSSTFAKEVSNIYNMKNINVLDDANLPAKASNMSFLKECIIYFMIGLVLSFGIIFVIFYFDNTLKSIDQVENRLKLPILGTIPLYSKGGK